MNEKIDVLDHGFVRLVDSMGDDSSVVQAARVSYGGGTKTAVEDEKLINYLMKNRHTTPFEMVVFKFHMKMPIFVARQLIRHRTASVNEYSGRYSEMKDEFYLPEETRLLAQDAVNKQGSSGEISAENRKNLSVSMRAEQSDARLRYSQYLAIGLSKELSRINLPLSQYTEWYWKMDLHNLFHFLGLRLDEHAQWECRQYAEAIQELIRPLVPLAYEAFEEHKLYSVTFSRSEIAELCEIMETLTGGLGELEKVHDALGTSVPKSLMKLLNG